MTTYTDLGYPTLLDLAKRLDPDGRIAQIAELLNTDNPILQDIPLMEANGATGHLVTDRTALPAVTSAWRKFNQGVDPTKSKTAQFTEACGMLEMKAVVDKKLAELNGNVDAFRASEAKPTIEALGQEVARAVFYQSASLDPEKIHGLSPRYPASTGYTASSYVKLGTSPSGVNCHSIWLITWGPETIFGIYPKGGKGGLQQKDMGLQYVPDASSKLFLAFVEQFNWDLGLCVRDYRHAVRYQWDPDEEADSEKTVYLALQDMVGLIKKIGPSSRFYMNRTSYAKLAAQLLSNDASALSFVEINGGRVPMIYGIPIRIEDALIAESALS